jgi:hypothetical protein
MISFFLIPLSSCLKLYKLPHLGLDLTQTAVGLAQYMPTWREELNLDLLAELGPQWWLVRVSMALSPAATQKSRSRSPSLRRLRLPCAN